MTGAEVALAAAAAPEILGATAAGTAAATGATAATLGAAGAGFGAMAGAPMAAAFGMTPEIAAGLGAGAGLMPGAAAAAAPVAGMGGGTAALFGAGTSGASPLAINLATTPMAAPSMGMPWAKMAGNMGQQMMRDQGGQQQPMAAPAQRPPQAGQPTSTQDILARLQRGMGPRSNMAGLLGQSIGGGYGRY